jgi:hypothetical protein
MPNYRFEIKTDKRRSGNHTSATRHCEYIQREGKYAELGKEELDSLSYNNFITGQHPIENLPESEMLLYSSPYGKILVDKSGVRFMKQLLLPYTLFQSGFLFLQEAAGGSLH